MAEKRTSLDLSVGHRRIHIVGAGGANMSALATVLAEMGHEVSGSDQQASPALSRLASCGVRTFVGHHRANLGKSEVVAFSAAVGPTNVELVEARKQGLVVLTRSELEAAICRLRRSVAVSGTHGKTTTTAMLAAVLEGAGTSPSFLVGGELAGGRPGARWGRGQWLVVEADESDGTFLRLPAEAVIVTSVEADHLDYFGDLPALEAAFAKFVAQAPGPKVVCVDDLGAARVVAKSAGLPGLVTYGRAEAASYAVSGVELSASSSRFIVSRRDNPSARGNSLGVFTLGVPGLHNVLDATAAIAMADQLGIDSGASRTALSTYRAVARRFQLRGEVGGVSYVDDYAHNPGKVAAALATARQGGWRRVVAVFQPHRYSRTEALWQELGQALAAADIVVVTGVYAAGEPPRPGVSGRMVADAARSARQGLAVYYEEDRRALSALVAGLLAPGDLCLTMGAGDLNLLPDDLMARRLETTTG
ncbi:MAG: UDP-N-acetylmuramate--L-alanine ligase [Actinobacteria bacterium]|nr:UDP-N-acetylmuramate--L-alanine ligase [Actinomycetota bacterium]